VDVDVDVDVDGGEESLNGDACTGEDSRFLFAEDDDDDDDDIGAMFAGGGSSALLGAELDGGKGEDLGANPAASKRNASSWLLMVGLWDVCVCREGVWRVELSPKDSPKRLEVSSLKAP
jgi:hypothetical protein